LPQGGHKGRPYYPIFSQLLSPGVESASVSVEPQRGERRYAG